MDVAGGLPAARLLAVIEEVRCPTCGECFAVSVPPPAELPARLDYDCEVCCRPMVIVVEEDGAAQALGTDESFTV